MPMNKLKGKHSPFAAACAVDFVEFTRGAEATDIRKITIQAKDANGQNLKERVSLPFYVSASAVGDGVHGTAVDTIAIAAYGTYIQQTAGLVGRLITDATGKVDINLTQDSVVADYYLVVILPDGRIQVSAVIAFA